MKWLKNEKNRSSDRMQREDVLILQFFINLAFGYIAGFLNQVRNIYFLVVLIPIIIPIVFSAMFLYGSETIMKIMGIVLSVLTTIALIIFVLFKASVWFRVMV